MRRRSLPCVCVVTALVQACGVSPPQPTRLTRLAGISPPELESMVCRKAPRNPWKPAANRDRFCTGRVGETHAAVHVDPLERVYRVSRSWSTTEESRWQFLSDSVRTALTGAARASLCAEFDDLPFLHTELWTSLNDLVELRTTSASECAEGNAGPGSDLRASARGLPTQIAVPVIGNSRLSTKG
jgi:hypothetical protein